MVKGKQPGRKYELACAKKAAMVESSIKGVEAMKIDTSFDFTSDSPRFWDTFWQNNYGMGGGGSDPDTASDTLKKYHQALWSKKLPNGDTLDLRACKAPDYLTWRDFRFGSDSIIVSFRHNKCRGLINAVKDALPDYQQFMEDFVHKTYTIGGAIIFPKHVNSMNQRKGCHPLIGDRWDLTLECIRRFYNGENSPLQSTLLADKAFYDLFVDFRGYVDFFYLQDCVADDYSSVTIWQGAGDFTENPYPQDVEQYLNWIHTQLDFTEKRNQRIAQASLPK